ncbi:TIGR03564 family F420-dependent LLM class oxidoreductase [Amycolatopsis anabasis]|uniref:TIGR03564 family F420-dependent LLM class oxidoreductase n=1 Tax=Amycolatopsis anabasis TaxID=1840409 RepID=UPI00131D9A6E|nr:TIGR03564 family F420-dependent LLM class oxidoreductase [Amycolatopsis anabasis]
MRIGLFLNELGAPVDAMVDQAREAAETGFTAAWAGQRTGWDVLSALAVVGREVPGIDLGTAVLPTYPRHPLALAAQALTVQSAIGNRLTLGLGVAHRHIVEGQLGLSFDRPARHLREYLSVLGPLLRGETVSRQGETLTAVGSIEAPGARPPSLLVGALGPAMLRVAGELADGTVTVWAGPRTIAEYIVPALTRAAGPRTNPRVVANVLVCVTGDEPARRAEIADQFGAAAEIPYYRAILDREGHTGIADTALIGDETAVVREIRRLADAGATELIAIPVGTEAEQTRTRQFLLPLAT